MTFPCSSSIPSTSQPRTYASPTCGTKGLDQSNWSRRAILGCTATKKHTSCLRRPRGDGASTFVQSMLSIYCGATPLTASQTTPPPCPPRSQPLRPPRLPVLPAASLSDHPASLSSPLTASQTTPPPCPPRC